MEVRLRDPFLKLGEKFVMAEDVRVETEFMNYEPYSCKHKRVFVTATRHWFIIGVQNKGTYRTPKFQSNILYSQLQRSLMSPTASQYYM